MSATIDASMKKARAKPRYRRLRRVIRILVKIEDGVLVVLLGAMILLSVGQVLMRNLFGLGFPWTDPMTRLLVLWVGLMGAMAASRNNKHINVDLVSRWLPESMQRAARAVTSFFTFVVCALVAYHAARFVYLDYTVGLVAFGWLPAWIAEAIMPLGLGVIALRYLLFCFVPYETAGPE